MGSKPLRIRLYKIDGSIKIYDRIKYMALFNNHFTFDWICDKIKYLISEKSSITDSINHTYARIRIDSSNSLPIEKI